MVKRARLAERNGKVAVVLDIPMEECPACGYRWITWDIAGWLDELFTEMLGSDVEVAIRNFGTADISTLQAGTPRDTSSNQALDR